MRELPKMCVDVVMASTIDGVIGMGGGLPWYIPEELKNFVKLTKGRVLIVGRKTAESLPKSMFSNDKYKRKILVATNSARESTGDTLQNLLKKCDKASVVPVIIGGASIYEQVLNNPELVCRIHISVVRQNVQGDTFVNLKDLFNFDRSANAIKSYEELKSHFKTAPAVETQKEFVKYTVEPSIEVYSLLKYKHARCKAVAGVVR